MTQAFPCNHGDGAFDPWCHLPLAGVVLDNLESAYRVRDLLSGIEVLRVVGGQETVIARLVDDPDTVQTCDCCTERYPACLAFHAASGRLLVSVELLPYDSTPSNGIPAGTRTFALSGLASMHELALS